MSNQADVDIRLITPIIESIETLLNKILNTSIERGKMYVLDIPFISMGVGAIISFSGIFNGKIFLDMCPDAALKLTQLYLKENITKFDKLAINTVAEILNMISGNIVGKIKNYGDIKISPPKIVTKFSKPSEYQDISHKNIVIIPLGFDKYIINVSFFIM